MKKLLLALLLACFAALHLAAEEGEAWFSKKFPAKLLTASGKTVDTATALKGKMVALYFSASWCGPCRGFTPQLVKFHKQVAKSGNFTVVFVSSDKTAKDMKAYMKKDKMPWFAIPFDGAERDAWKKEMKVSGIPTLVVFDENGKLLSSNARWDVVILGKKAINAWKSEDYKPLTYNDYKAKGGKSKKSRKKK